MQVIFYLTSNFAGDLTHAVTLRTLCSLVVVVHALRALLITFIILRVVFIIYLSHKIIFKFFKSFFRPLHYYFTLVP